MKKEKTLAELKRQANTGEMSLFMLEWHGNTGKNIPPLCQGVRKVLKANSVGLVLLSNHPQKGEVESSLLIPCAKSISYDGEYLSVYSAGYRKPTEEEQAVLDEWKRLNEEYYRKNPCGDNYLQMVDYFNNSKYPYMNGLKEKNGKMYLPHKEMVRDDAVKGYVMLSYRVIFGKCPLSDEEILEREEALKADKTKYFYDDNGNEYWYSRTDMKKHYTKEEG